MTDGSGLIDLAGGLLVVGVASKMLSDVQKDRHFSPKRKPIKKMREK